jgi:hypothetical protein
MERHNKMRAVHEIRNHPGWRGMLQMICDPEQDVVWRVAFHANGSLNMSYIGYVKRRPHDYEVREYSSIDKTPEWVKDKLAVLNMMPPNPNESVVYGVGRRVDHRTFWIVEPSDADGIDP